MRAFKTASILVSGTSAGADVGSICFEPLSERRVMGSNLRSGSVESYVNSHYEYWQYKYSTGQNVRWENADAISSKTRNSWSGFATPNFHRRVRLGELIPHTPWQKNHDTVTVSGQIGVLSARQPDGHFDLWWSEGNYPILSASYFSSDFINTLVPSGAFSLVQAAASKIYEEGHDTLTFVTELAKTKRMFLDTGARLLKAKFPRNWRQMSNDWLSYRYGWRTFGYDCKSIQKSLKRLDEKRSRYSKCSRDIDSWTQSTNAQWQGTHAGTSFQFTSEGSTDISVAAVGTVNADITVPAFQFNPVVTAWELIPYSFVFDWFLDVGQALSALSFLALSKRYAASWGCLITAKEETSFTGYSIKPGVTGTASGSVSRESNIRIRVPCSVPISPQRAFKINTAKIVDLVSLLIQKSRRV